MNKNFSHTINYFLGSLLIKATGFISIPFFTNFLTIGEYGVLSLYLSFISFFTTLLSVGILGSIKRYYFEPNKSFDSFLFSNIVFLMILDVCIVTVCLYYSSSISNLISVNVQVLKYIFITSFFCVYIKIYLDYLQITENSIKYNIVDFVKTVVVLIMAIVFIIYIESNKFYGKIYADLIGCGILFLYSMFKISEQIKVKFNFHYIKYSLLFGLPVLPSMFASFALTFSDRIMINSFLDIDDVGLYSLAFNVSIIIQVVILAIGKSWQPIFYKCMNEKNFDGLNEIFLNNTKIILVAALSVIYFSQELIVILSNDNYIETKNVVINLVIGFNFFYLYTIFGQYTSYAKKTYYNSIFMIIVAALNVCLNYYLIPMFGYKVAAITTAVCYLVMFLLFYLNAKYSLNFTIVKLSVVFKVHFFYIFFIGIFLGLENLLNNYMQLFILKLIVVFVFTLILFKNFVVMFYNKKNP
jgi:O-antigen/teichoic acid export membrane protein